MSEEILSVPDILASVTADVDQAQAMIDEARSKFKNDLNFQKTLDEQQFQLDIRKERIRVMKSISDIIYSK